MLHALRYLVIASLLLSLPGLCPAETLQQIVSHEHPYYDGATRPDGAGTSAHARMTVGKDGLIYLANTGKSGGGIYGYVLRMSRDGSRKQGAEVLPSCYSAVANRDGVIATAQAGYAGNKLAVYDKSFRLLGTVDDFEKGGHAPNHVEAGASGDFYGLDLNRSRIVRVSPSGKPVKVYPLEAVGPHAATTCWDMRVCERDESFYLLPHLDPVFRILCFGFDGKLRWKYEAGVSAFGDAYGWVGAFDVDDAGTLYVLDRQTVRKIDSQGRPVGELTLRVADAARRPDGPGFAFLRVYDDELIVRRTDPGEFFQVYDVTTGALKRVLRTDHEELNVSFDGEVWTAGKAVPIDIRLTAGDRTLSPRWRVWARPFAALDYREFAVNERSVQVPPDCAGLYLIKVTPEVQPWQRGSISDYIVRALVEIRQPGSHGSATVVTENNRAHFGRGEEIPFRVVVRTAAAPEAFKFVVKLSDGKRTLAQSNGVADRNQSVRFTVSSTITAGLPTGRYALTIDAPGFTCSEQPLFIGPGLTKSPFRITQHSDYMHSYPVADIWDATELAAAHATRAAKLEFNMMFDRLGAGDGPLNLAWDRNRQAELEGIEKRLRESVEGVAPERARLETSLGQTVGVYGSLGIEQMASLVNMDGGLPIGSRQGFDQRSREQFSEAITRVNDAFKPYPAFRGWCWATNWWLFDSPGVKAAKSPEEETACIAAVQSADRDGTWDPVLDKVSGYRLNYAVEAVDFFNSKLQEISPGKVTATAGPYRQLWVYPPITYAHVDEVSLHYQAEQIPPPGVGPHNVDFQKRPGKPAWGHPEVGNDAGTGDQILPVLFQMVMRGVDGTGRSGPTPAWGPQPWDARSAYPGTTSVMRGVNGLLKHYGPWLTTLKNNDQVAIVVSSRMCRLIEDPRDPKQALWKGIGGRYFTRIFEAYHACLHAHYPAALVFVDDLQPDTLQRYKAVLVVGQTVEMEPALGEALAAAKTAGTAIFHDDTCRRSVVTDFTPLGTAFDKVENDPSVWQDDTAYRRFAGYYQTHAPLVARALDGVLPPVAGVENQEVLLSERTGEQGRYLFVVNDTMPDLDPAQIWRATLAIATRVPMQVPVRLRGPGPAVYDVFGLRRVEPRAGVVEADLRNLPARLYALLPASIGRIALQGPKVVKEGQAFAWAAEVQDEKGKTIPASVPLRMRLMDGAGGIIDERFEAAGSNGATGTLHAALAGPGTQTLEATELFSGRTARLPIKVEAAAGQASLAAVAKEPVLAEIRKPDNALVGTETDKTMAPADESFGPHVRDLVITERGGMAVMNTMNWDHNLYAVDTATGKLRWRQRAGHYFAVDPQPLASGIAVQGYDLISAEDYHLYLVDGKGKLERRFALYGLPQRQPHRFLSGVFPADHVNNFAVPSDGSWVASAGDLGLAVWSRAGKLLWSHDWWKEGDRHTAVLAAPNGDTLLAVRALQLSAFAAADGSERWRLSLAGSGEALRVACSREGRTIALLSKEDGRIFVVRDGAVAATFSGAASGMNLRHLSTASTNSTLGVTGMELSADGSLLAVTSGNLLKLFSVADGLQWILPADDTLHAPRFSPDGRRLAVGSELGTLYVLDTKGDIALERDLGALPVAAWLPDGDLVVAAWQGTVCRLDAKYAERWRTRLTPATADMRARLVADDGAPTTRIAFQGNAAPTPAPLAPSLLGWKEQLIHLNWIDRHGQLRPDVTLAADPAALVDGKPDAPPAPWIAWPQMNWYGEGTDREFNSAILIDTYRTQLRVTGVTLVEDPAHPESWLRDATFEYWDPVTEQWVHVQPLLSDAAVHTHVFARPVEARRFRIVLPRRLCGNLRLGEIVFHGQKLGTSHPDIRARRPVAVLFDETTLEGCLHGASFSEKRAYAGRRFLTVPRDAEGSPPWPNGAVFGSTLPDWDFEVVEDPQPGQYRYLQFAWRAPDARGINFQLHNVQGQIPLFATIHAGALAEGIGPRYVKKVADEPPADWKLVQVDLWELFQAPVRIRGMRLSGIDGPAEFDQILLARSIKDLPDPRTP